MSLEITNVQINMTKSSSKILAFAKITFEDSFCVDGIKIIDGPNGLFVGMPSKKDKNGNFQNICFPINKEARAAIVDRIFEEYNKKKEDNNDPF